MRVMYPASASPEKEGVSKEMETRRVRLHHKAITWEVVFPLYCNKVDVCGGVEAVDIFHQKVISVLDVNPQETLLREGELRKIEVV